MRVYESVMPRRSAVWLAVVATLAGLGFRSVSLGARSDSDAARIVAGLAATVLPGFRPVFFDPSQRTLSQPRKAHQAVPGESATRSVPPPTDAEIDHGGAGLPGSTARWPRPAPRSLRHA